MFQSILLFIAILLTFSNDVICQDSTGEVGLVKIHFMDYKKSEFISQFQLGIKESIAHRLSEFCRVEANDCMRENNANYTIEDIGFHGATEKDKLHEEGRFIIVKLFAKDNDKYLSSQLLERFVEEHRANIVSDGKVAIAYVNGKLVYPPRDNLDNYIIVSISCGFVVVLVIFNIICLKKRENEIKKEFISKVKKSSIYADRSDSHDGVKKRSNKQNERELQPLNVNEEDTDVQRFPIPEDVPMLTTSKLSNIRTSPQMKLTQV